MSNDTSSKSTAATTSAHDSRSEPDRNPNPDGGRGPDSSRRDDDGGLSDRAAFWISALIALAVAIGSVAVVTRFAPFFEAVMRVRPTVEGGGVGADWVAGNTDAVLNAAIAIVHFVDVLMGIFLILMVVIHWAAFRRLADRMQPPAERRASTADVAADGGASVSERTNSSVDGSDGTRANAPGDDSGDRSGGETA
ncbi:hypothetical protein ACFQGT_08705 [Natrialbaceae archaeon GCM10025810]|uniref:hypothetical protein n=1 Tax=Halovalidus salilacus TaxID=3075124 RepID=UPI003616B547